MLITQAVVFGKSQHDIADISNLGGPSGALMFYCLLNQTVVPSNGYPQFM